MTYVIWLGQGELNSKAGRVVYFKKYHSSIFYKFNFSPVPNLIHIILISLRPRRIEVKSENRLPACPIALALRPQSS